MTSTLEILDKLIGFDTVSAKSNLDLIEYAESFLKGRGFTTNRIPDETGQKAGIYAEKGPAGDGILLSGHTDVVPVEGQSWSGNPFQLRQDGDKLYGRGTTDMKGYVASVLALADRSAQADLKEPLKISLSYDEEIGCVGIRNMMEHLVPLLGTPRACFVGEPTEMQVAIGHKGKAALRAVCRGQSGHSALAPQFVNALHMASDFIVELRNLQADLAKSGGRDLGYAVPYSTVHVGKMNGGMALNIVPDHAEIIFEYRHLAADRAEDILSRIKATAERVEQSYRRTSSEAAIEIDPYNCYPGLDVTEAAPVVAMAQRLAQTDTTTKVAFGTEAGFFDQLGIPTIVCGPGSMEGQGHKPDEYVSLGQIVACDAMMDRILAELRT